MIETRLRTKISEQELEAKKGRMLLPNDVNIMLTGPVRVLKPDGSPLCVYLPGAINGGMREEAMPALQALKGSYTSNRGMASGSERIKGASTRSYSLLVDSAIVGSFEATGPKQYCRLTAWTRDNLEQWAGLHPLLQFISKRLQENVPERFANQARQAMATAPDWLIPGTPFTTVTVNNTYATAVHTDKGDLESGFSTLAVFRSGDFEGGWLCFPEYRVGVDMRDGDLLLMDAHEWHGNTPFTPNPEREVSGKLKGDPGFERISVVAYFRTNMTKCADANTEQEKQAALLENRAAAMVGE